MAATLDSSRVDLTDSCTLVSAWHRRLTMADFFPSFSAATSSNNFAGSLHLGFIMTFVLAFVMGNNGMRSISGAVPKNAE